MLGIFFMPWQINDLVVLYFFHFDRQVLYNLLGEALSHVGELDEAEKWHLAAMEAKPTHVATHLMYGRLLAKNVSTYTNDLVTSRRNLFIWYFSISRNFSQRSRIAEAEQRFLKAQELAPGDPNVHQHYGRYLHIGEIRLDWVFSTSFYFDDKAPGYLWRLKCKLRRELSKYVFFLGWWNFFPRGEINLNETYVFLLAGNWRRHYSYHVSARIRN